MATTLGALANIAAEYSDSEFETDIEDEEDIVEYEKDRDFVRECILGLVIKESVRRVEYAKSINYRNNQTNEIQITDSSSPNSSTQESSSEDSSSDSDTEGLIIVSNKEASKSLKKGSKCPPKVKGELLPSDLPPIEDLHITVPEYECLEVGTVSSIVDQMVVVKSKPNTAALDLDSILFLDKGQKPLGKVFDVIGPVMQPFYCVRFNSNDHIREKNIEIGNPIFFAPRTEHTNFVFLAELMKMKGSDASWENDKEPPNSNVDFSDDEQERQARKAHKRPAANDKNSDQSSVYVSPAPQIRDNNAFYRRERRYNPRNYGPIQWRSSHTQHLNNAYGIRPPPRPQGLGGPPLYNYPPPPLPPRQFRPS